MSRQILEQVYQELRTLTVKQLEQAKIQACIDMPDTAHIFWAQADYTILQKKTGVWA